MPIIIPEKCPQNHTCPCIRICPAGAISQKGYGAPEINMTICINCGKCIMTCPTGAIARGN
jgi:ferredoxin